MPSNSHTDPAGEGGLDATLRALTSPVRRDLLALLSDRGRVQREDARWYLAEYRDHGDPAEVAAALRHRHLPTLEAAGLLDRRASGSVLVYAGDARADALLEVLLEA